MNFVVNTTSVVVECIPIKKVNETYERVVNSDVRYRFVIDNKSLAS
jgi:alcohol dehydrogenase (NADP+)